MCHGPVGLPVGTPDGQGCTAGVGGAARMRESGTPFICFPRFLKRCEEWLMSSAIVCQVL